MFRCVICACKKYEDEVTFTIPVIEGIESNERVIVCDECMDKFEANDAKIEMMKNLMVSGQAKGMVYGG